MNASYEGKYVFSGSDGHNSPFKLTNNPDGTQTLTYRGVDVNQGTDQNPNAALDSLSKDTLFVDLGFGLDFESNGDVDPSSAFNTSLPGINVIGYGLDDDGDPKNMVLLAGLIADELEKPDFDYDRYEQLLNKFEAGRDNVLEKVTTLGTQTEFLTTTKERLETNKINLSTQVDNVVNADMAEAIMDFSWAQYAYNAALKVGNNILTPSFIDFMS